MISVAQVGMTPMSGSGWNNSVHPDSSNDAAKNSFFNHFGPGYLKTMGIGLIAGRDFNDRDTLNAPQVAIVNEAFAKSFYKGANPVGHTFRVEAGAGEADRVYEVVGLIRNTKYYELREDFLPTAFFPMVQDKESRQRHQLHDPNRRAPAVHLRHGEERGRPGESGTVLDFTVFTTQIADTLLRDRLMATLAGAFGLLAAILAAIGL